jgi:hypothetical protein
MVSTEPHTQLSTELGVVSPQPTMRGGADHSMSLSCPTASQPDQWEHPIKRIDPRRCWKTLPDLSRSDTRVYSFGRR